MVRPNSDYHLLAEGYYAGFEDNSPEDLEIIATKMVKFLKDADCPDKILYEIIQEYFGKDSPYELDLFCEQCECGTLLGGQVFFDEDEYDEHPDRDAGWDQENKWFCQECR